MIRSMTLSLTVGAVLLATVGTATALELLGTGTGEGVRTMGVLPQAQSDSVGRRIWQNECGGSVDLLTFWNKNEGFPSLGIGHFIWYTAAGGDRFDETFPGLVRYLQQRGAAVPPWLAAARYCPWASKAEFDADKDSPRMTELRDLLASTVGLQTDFIAERLARSLPTMVATLPTAAERSLVEGRFHALYRTPAGLFALMDYVNFKGEGTKESERYRGQGWGLLQVLQGMEGRPTGSAAVDQFSASARRALERRVANSPPERGEGRWLPGWTKRVEAYRTPA